MLVTTTPPLVRRPVIHGRITPVTLASKHRKSKNVRRSRAWAAWVFHGADASHTEKYRFSATSYPPAGLIRNGCPSGTPRSSNL